MSLKIICILLWNHLNVKEFKIQNDSLSSMQVIIGKKVMFIPHIMPSNQLLIHKFCNERHWRRCYQEKRVISYRNDMESKDRNSFC